MTTYIAGKSTWRSFRSKDAYPAISESASADVVIVGGGLAGILTAYALSELGKSVIVLEKEEVGAGVTGRTSAFLTEAIDTDFQDCISSFGLDSARLIIGSHRDAIGYIESIIKRHGIECDFKRTSNHIFANSPDQLKWLRAEYAAARKLGVSAQFRARGLKLGFRNAGYFEIENQAMFHPLKFLFTLARICATQGVRIFEHSEATIEVQGEQVLVHANGYTVTGTWAVSATYEPLGEPLRLFFTKAMYLSYVFELMVRGEDLKEGLYEDAENPYHYFRIEKDQEKQEGEKGAHRIIVGGEDHRRDLPVDEVKSFNALKNYIDTILPGAAYEIRTLWRGGVLEPVDGLAMIGPRNGEPILYASAFSGSGMTYSAIAAQLLTRYVESPKEALNPLARIYVPSRIPGFRALLTKGRDYLGEMAGGAIKNTFSESSVPASALSHKARF